MIPGVARRATWVLAGLTLLAFGLRLAGLDGQPPTPDDAAVGRTAMNFVERGWPEPTMWNHPRLRDLLTHASLGLLGHGALGLKAWSVLLGTLSVPATAALVLTLTGSLPAAGIAGLLLAVDPLHVDFSRQAINDVHLAFFPVAAVLALLAFRATRRPAWIAAAGLLLGLGVAEKWSAAFPVAAAAAAVLAGALSLDRSWRERTATLALFAGCLVALPLAVYLATFLPWFGRGHDLAEWIRFQKAMATETATHVGYVGTKLPGYPGEVVQAWRWFVQPVWYSDHIPPMPGRDLPAGGLFIVGVPCPLAWLATLPAAAWAAWRWLRSRDEGAGWLLLLLAAAYLPFVLVPRPIWTNSALSVAPFAMAIVGWAAARLLERWRAPVLAWLAASVVLSAVLWAPAVGRSTAAGDAAVRALVSPAALDPANRP
jgi:dolichyl-phosphate-mannose-protein mannosyltransferase